MPLNRNGLICIQDICRAVSKILAHTAGMDFAVFSKDERIIDAVLYNFTIIGEAARNVPEALRQSYPEIPWVDMQDMRNIVVHEYFGVDLQIIWKTIRDDLPPLLRALGDALKKSGQGS